MITGSFIFNSLLKACEIKWKNAELALDILLKINPGCSELGYKILGKFLVIYL